MPNNCHNWGNSKNLQCHNKWLMIEGMQACWYYKDLGRPCSLHLTTFGYEELTCWVPCFLMVDQKETGIISQEFLNMFKYNSTSFCNIALLLMKHGIIITYQRQSNSAPKKANVLNQQEKSWPLFFGLLKV